MNKSIGMYVSGAFMKMVVHIVDNIDDPLRDRLTEVDGQYLHWKEYEKFNQ